MTSNDFKKIIGNSNSIGIAGHVRPDGDCVGSTLAVYNYIASAFPDKNIHIFLEPIPNIFKFMKNSDKIINTCEDNYDFDLFICLDCGDLGRLGQAASYFSKADRTMCIDHHVSNQVFADDNYIFPDASSTCELVFELIGAENINKDIAECLYTGMVHDTGVFQYSCTSAKTMDIAGQLMEMDIDYPKIVDETFYTKTYNQNKILGQALLKSQLHFDGACISSIITREDMQKFDVLPKHLDGIVNQLRVTKDVKVALFVYENEDGTFKGSLRVNGDIDVAEIAACFGGGGHVKAAGFTIDGPIEETISDVLDVIKEKL